MRPTERPPRPALLSPLCERPTEVGRAIYLSRLMHSPLEQRLARRSCRRCGDAPPAEGGELRDLGDGRWSNCRCRGLERLISTLAILAAASRLCRGDQAGNTDQPNRARNVVGQRRQAELARTISAAAAGSRLGSSPDLDRLRQIGRFSGPGLILRRSSSVQTPRSGAVLIPVEGLVGHVDHHALGVEVLVERLRPELVSSP